MTTTTRSGSPAAVRGRPAAGGRAGAAAARCRPPRAPRSRRRQAPRPPPRSGTRQHRVHARALRGPLRPWRLASSASPAWFAAPSISRGSACGRSAPAPTHHTRPPHRVTRLLACLAQLFAAQAAPPGPGSDSVVVTGEDARRGGGARGGAAHRLPAMLQAAVAASPQRAAGPGGVGARAGGRAAASAGGAEEEGDLPTKMECVICLGGIKHAHKRPRCQKRSQ